MEGSFYLDITHELAHKHPALLRTKLEFLLVLHKVQILHDSVGLLGRLFIEKTTDEGALEIIGLVDILIDTLG